MHLSNLVKSIVISIPLLCSASVFAEGYQKMAKEQKFLVGTWTGSPQDLKLPPAFPSEGIYTVQLNKDGSLLPLNELKLAHPSWIAFSPNKKNIYVTNETEAGNVTALSLNKKGQLKILNTVKSLGDHPTHASVSPDGKYVFVANYSVAPNNAGISAYQVKNNGSLSEAVQNIPFIEGTNTVLDRQKSGHAHSVVFSPDGKILFAADLGNDIIRAYHYSAKNKQPLQAEPSLDLYFAKGSGPRHLIFSDNGKYLYVTTEMTAKVIVFEKKDNQYVEVQNESLAAKDQEEHKSAAGIIFSPDKKFLYVGNRKEINEIVAYKVNQQTGKLSLVGRYGSGGLEPRSFAIDNTGNYMIVSNVYTHTVSQFKRNKTTGALTPTRVALQIGLPTDIKFIP